jgi:hypothetical protein
MGLKARDKIFMRRMEFRTRRAFERALRGDSTSKTAPFSRGELERMREIEFHALAELERAGKRELAEQRRVKLRELDHILDGLAHAALKSVLAGAAATPQPEAINNPPQLGVRLILLVLRTKEERANIPGDLEEEFKQIAAKHGARYAKLWYYKQVVSSAWPLIRKAAGWGLLASIGAWIRRLI